MKRLAALPLLLLGLAPLPDRAAQAQVMFEPCVEHRAVLNIRTRYVYRDWQGTEHRSGWVTGQGIENCARWQDVQAARVEVQRMGDWGWWVDLCSVQITQLSGKPRFEVIGNQYMVFCRPR